ncbi:TolC family outer membrane protein [Pusillimonas sp. SM2304]|uniref:TolC family outer membrane protein n=1 Tax=Pusillimonas sp. SM2304 TaxID=3073241 RepID=UPI0028740BB9|nr:TolC family outer membrane protein [Pusillimonas sp. SM2304]MDS1139250.1 TolC family outer membrane protein [Pusillimonas sp. SM2304]
MAKAGKYVTLGLALLLAASALPGHAQASRQPTQDLLQIWQMAIQRDPIFAASQAGRNAEQEKIPQARAQLLPYVTADTVAELNDRRRISGLNNSNSDRRALWALTLTQPIIDLSAWGGLKRAEYIASLADVAQANAYQDLILRVSQAYFDVLAAQDTLRALRAEKAAVETQLRAARQGFELGSTTIADTYEAQARLDLLNAGELQAENALQINQDELARLINERPGQLAELAPGTELPGPNPNRLSDWTHQSSNASLTVAQADLAAKIAEKQIDIAKSQHYPRLSLQAQTGSASDRGLYNTDGGPRSLNSSIGLQLSIPIFTGGEISSVVREQTSRLQQARYELENAKRQAVQSTQQHFSGVTSGLAQIKALQAAEKSSQASLQANQTGYEVGVRINIDVLNAQQQLYETQRSLSRARYDTLMSSLRLKASSGILTDQDIVAINQLLTDRPS